MTAPPGDSGGAEAAPRRQVQRHHVLTGGWMAITTVWGVGRIAVVAATLSKYGVNPWVFALVECVTSPIYGLATARLARLLQTRDHRGAPRWAVIAVVGYLMPDAYILGSARRMPGRVFVVVLGAAVVLALISLVLFVRSVRQERAACAAVAPGAAAGA